VANAEHDREKYHQGADRQEAFELKKGKRVWGV
jgi:hypothetical protein